mgnify:CR=1 FL=1
MSLSQIVAGTQTFELFSAPTSNGDPAIWRVETPTLAPMYRPTLRLQSKQNAKGTNVNMTVKASVPIVTNVDGVQTSLNTAIASASVTSLQNVTGDAVKNAIDALIAGLTATREAIIAGKTSV